MDYFVDDDDEYACMYAIKEITHKIPFPFNSIPPFPVSQKIPVVLYLLMTSCLVSSRLSSCREKMCVQNIPQLRCPSHPENATSRKMYASLMMKNSQRPPQKRPQMPNSKTLKLQKWGIHWQDSSQSPVRRYHPPNFVVLANSRDSKLYRANSFFSLRRRDLLLDAAVPKCGHRSVISERLLAPKRCGPQYLSCGQVLLPSHKCPKMLSLRRTGCWLPKTSCLLQN